MDLFNLRVCALCGRTLGAREQTTVRLSAACGSTMVVESCLRCRDITVGKMQRLLEGLASDLLRVRVNGVVFVATS